MLQSDITYWMVQSGTTYWMLESDIIYWMLQRDAIYWMVQRDTTDRMLQIAQVIYSLDSSSSDVTIRWLVPSDVSIQLLELDDLSPEYQRVSET